MATIQIDFLNVKKNLVPEKLDPRIVMPRENCNIPPFSHSDPPS